MIVAPRVPLVKNKGLETENTFSELFKLLSACCKLFTFAISMLAFDTMVWLMVVIASTEFNKLKDEES